MGERWPREKETVNGGRVEEIGGEGGRERWKERNRGGKVEAGGSRWRQSCSLGWLAGWLAAGKMQLRCLAAGHS